jgi:hypothetical protein
MAKKNEKASRIAKEVKMKVYFIEEVKDLITRKVIVPILEAVARVVFWIFLPAFYFKEINYQVKEFLDVAFLFCLWLEAKVYLLLSGNELKLPAFNYYLKGGRK